MFIGIGGALGTPPLSCGALPGITRAAILELAAGLGITVAERAIPGDALFDADEIFLTSSLRAIAPVISVNRAPVGPSTPGPLTRRLMTEYASLVRCETRM